MGIFDRANIGNEEFSGSASAEMNIHEDIDGDTAYADAMEIAQEALLDANAISEAEKIVVNLEGMVAANEEMLADPSLVTGSAVVIANEAFIATAMLTGYDMEEATGMVSSNEGSMDSPISALQASNEGVKDFLKKLYASIKLIFKRVANAVKKLVVKLVVAMNSVEKKAKKLKDKLKKSTTTKPKKDKLDDKVAKSMHKRLSAIVNVSSETKNLEIANVTKAMENIAGFTTGIKALVDVGTKYNELVGDENVKTSETDVLAAIIDKIGGTVSVTVPDCGEGVKCIPFSAVKSVIKYVEVSVEDAKHSGSDAITSGNNKKKSTNTHSATLKFKVTSTRSDLTVDSDIPAGDMTAVTGGLTELEKQAKGLKKYSETQLKEIDNLSKSLDKMADAKSDNFANKALLKLKSSAATNSRVLVTGVFLTNILDYATNTKMFLSYYNEHAKLLTVNEL